MKVRRRIAKMHRGAVLDETSKYRFQLTRRWGYGSRMCTFLLLNPSTADAMKDDPTIRRCIGFAQSWKCDALTVVNLFAWRATDPRKLLVVPNPEGWGNQWYIRRAAASASVFVCGWGSNGIARMECRRILDSIELFAPMMCLGTTKDGSPRHPLYVASGTEPTKWDFPE
jgi:hypothetical protein